MAKVKSSLVQYSGAVGREIHYTRFGRTYSRRLPAEYNDRKSEANQPLDYNAWNRGIKFTEKTYEECPDDYKTHPGLLKLNENDKGSSAAGAYQFLKRYYT